MGFVEATVTDQQLIDAAWDLRSATNEIKRAEARRAKARNIINAYVEENMANSLDQTKINITVGINLIEIINYQKKTYDYEALNKSYPELMKQFTYIQPARRITVKDA